MLKQTSRMEALSIRVTANPIAWRLNLIGWTAKRFDEIGLI